MNSAALAQIGRFLAVGVLNTAFGYAIYAIALLAGLAPAFALATALVCGVVFNFFTTGRLVFREASPSFFPKFVAAYVVVYVFNLILLNWIIGFGVGPLLAQAISLPPTVIFTFVLMKLVVFRRSSRSG